MKKAIITVGAPGSGKSTYAEELVDNSNEKWVILERDLIRAEICKQLGLFVYDSYTDNFQELYYSLDKKTINNIEKDVTFKIDGYINSFTDNLILSNTNIGIKRRNHLYANLVDKGYEVEFKVFNPSLDDLLEQNGWRNDVVTDDIVFSMYQKLQHEMADLRSLPNCEFVSDHENFDGNYHNCVIVDLDGTLAHITKDKAGNPIRNHYQMDKVDKDEFDDIVFSMVRGLMKSYDAKLIFLTGRTANCFNKTIEWLDDNLSFYNLSHASGGYQLFSRLNNDFRKDFVIKEELYNTFIKDNYNVLAVFDDRPVCCNLWNDLGLKTIAVADQRNTF